VNVYIGCGANVGTREEMVARLASVMEIFSARTDHPICSQVYLSEPVGPVTIQSDFINCVVRLTVPHGDQVAEPLALLHWLLDIEAQLGRDREHEVPQGPRAIDLDLLLMGDLFVQQREVIVPHPRITRRAFVLLPLAELEGDGMVIPGQSLPLRYWLEREPVCSQRIHSLGSLPFTL